MDKFDASWFEAIGRVLFEPIVIQIAKKVNAEREEKEVLPPTGSNLIFEAFNITPLKEVKVVILGQDPYHDVNSYNGLAFGNGKPDEDYTGTISPSLRNVLKEAKENEDDKIDVSLYSWAKQGVLLINTAHTVVKGDPGSHLKIWEDFTEIIMDALQTKSNVVWMMWGAKAQNYIPRITNDTHAIISTGHPSPLNRNGTFNGSGCFKKCNELLKEMGLKEIQWTI